MAGKPPRPGPSRESYVPSSAAEPARGGQAAQPGRAATQMVRASEVQRAREEPPEPPPPKKPRPVDLKGASTGRALNLGSDDPAPGAAPAAPQGDDDLSPFQKFAPRADQLAGAAQARSAESFQVMAIVAGLIFIVAAAAVVVLLVVGVGWYTVGDMIEDGTLAGLGPDQDHIGDTDVAEDIVKKPVPGKPRSGGGAVAGDDPVAEPEPTAPTTGSGTILVNGDLLFHSIEVNCPSSGIRTRAEFRNMKATAHGLPTNEDCTVTFQGGQPAKATIRGNQTKSCTFNPTLCRLQ